MAGVRDFPFRPHEAEVDSDDFMGWLDGLGDRQNIDMQIALTSVASGDEVGIFDVSASAFRKITIQNLLAQVSIAQSFLANDVPLNDSTLYFDTAVTASIGASGDRILLLAYACVLDTVAAATFKVRLWDGTTVFAETEVTTSAANFDFVVPIFALVTPSAAKSYRLSVKDASANTGVAKTTGTAAGTANKATSIIAVKI